MSKTTTKTSKGFSLEDLQKKWAAEERFDKKHPVRTKIKNIYYFFRYTIIRKIDDWKYDVKWGCQRMFRDYDDPYVWNYYSENAKLAIKVLTHLKKHKHGFPGILLTKKKISQSEGEKQWNDILDKMIKGWQALLKEDNVFYKTNGTYDRVKSDKKRKELLKIWERGMLLYVKYYQNLWD